LDEGAWTEGENGPDAGRPTGASEVAVITLDCDGRVTGWNRDAAAAPIDPTVIGRPLADFLPPEDVAAGKPARILERARETGFY
jgi:hypothetical protein